MQLFAYMTAPCSKKIWLAASEAGSGYPFLPVPFLWFGSSRNGSILDQVYPTFYDQVLLHLLPPVTEVWSIELSKTIFDDPDVNVIVPRVMCHCSSSKSQIEDKDNLSCPEWFQFGLGTGHVNSVWSSCHGQGS